jgi:hypothetical protein
LLLSALDNAVMNVANTFQCLARGITALQRRLEAARARKLPCTAIRRVGAARTAIHAFPFTNMSLFAASLAQLPLVKGGDGQILTQNFLGVARLILPVVGGVCATHAGRARGSAMVPHQLTPRAAGCRMQSNSARPSPWSKATWAAT